VLLDTRDVPYVRNQGSYRSRDAHLGHAHRRADLALVRDRCVVAREPLFRARCSALRHVEEAPQGFSDDLTRSGVIGLGTGFDRFPQFRVDSYRDYICGS
jgi:hypothetical protein